MTTRRKILAAMGGLGLLGSGYVWSRFNRMFAAAGRRVSGRSSLIETQFGTLEFASAGAGSPLLMIHGTGGGFDQGLRFASALGQREHRIIAPSRFGYLRSDFPADPSLSNQADAFATLLDRLAIDRIPVIGGSAGALSAAAFALRHPSRCSSLTLLVPAANLSGKDPVEMSALQESMVRTLLNSDFVYWSVLEIAPERLIETLLATDPALLAKVSDSERKRAFAILNDMMPIRARAKGMLNDAWQAGHLSGLDFAGLTMPVLIISVEDDRFGTAATARKLAEIVLHAKLVILPDGGHIWLGHDETVADLIHSFVKVEAD